MRASGYHGAIPPGGRFVPTRPVAGARAPSGAHMPGAAAAGTMPGTRPVPPSGTVPGFAGGVSGGMAGGIPAGPPRPPGAAAAPAGGA